MIHVLFQAWGMCMYVKDKRVKKKSVKARAENPKSTKISTDSVAILIQENNELKTQLLGVERGRRLFTTPWKSLSSKKSYKRCW